MWSCYQTLDFNEKNPPFEKQYSSVPNNRLLLTIIRDDFLNFQTQLLGEQELCYLLSFVWNWEKGMQSKFELNRTKAVDLRRIGNFNQANVLNNHTWLLLGTQEYLQKSCHCETLQWIYRWFFCNLVFQPILICSFPFM